MMIGIAKTINWLVLVSASNQSVLVSQLFLVSPINWHPDGFFKNRYWNVNVDWQPHSDVFSSIKAAAITDIVHVGLLMDIVHAMCLLTDICTCYGLAYRYCTVGLPTILTIWWFSVKLARIGKRQGLSFHHPGFWDKSMTVSMWWWMVCEKVWSDWRVLLGGLCKCVCMFSSEGFCVTLQAFYVLGDVFWYIEI